MKKAPPMKGSQFVNADGSATALAGFIAGTLVTAVVFAVVLYFAGQFLDLPARLSL